MQCRSALIDPLIDASAATIECSNGMRLVLPHKTEGAFWEDNAWLAEYGSLAGMHTTVCSSKGPCLEDIDCLLHHQPHIVPPLGHLAYKLTKTVRHCQFAFSSKHLKLEPSNRSIIAVVQAWIVHLRSCGSFGTSSCKCKPELTLVLRQSCASNTEELSGCHGNLQCNTGTVVFDWLCLIVECN